MSSPLDQYLGKKVDTLTSDVLDELFREGYTISPRSGRVRKRINRQKRFYERHRFRKGARNAFWIMLILLFIASLVILLPQMQQQQDPKAKYKMQKK